MPSITLPFGQSGPLIQVVIGVSAPHSAALIAANQPVPPGVVGTFLIDTGASCTCVDPGLVAPLALKQTGVAMMQTPSTQGQPHPCLQYDVMLFIPGSGPNVMGHLIDALPVMETHLRTQGIDGLLGRDVLQDCVLIANGPANTLTLSY